MSEKSIAIAVYHSHEQAEEAVRQLLQAGFDRQAISIVGKDYHTEEHVVGYFNAGDRAKFFGKLGAFWGGLGGMLVGSMLMFVPVVGHIVVIGPLAAMIAGGIQGAVVGGGLSALLGALTALGVPKNSVLRYESEIKADHFLVIVHAGADDVERAREVLAGAGSQDIEAVPAQTDLAKG